MTCTAGGGGARKHTYTCAYVSFPNDYRLLWRFNGEKFILAGKRFYAMIDEWIIEE